RDSGTLEQRASFTSRALQRARLDAFMVERLTLVTRHSGLTSSWGGWCTGGLPASVTRLPIAAGKALERNAEPAGARRPRAACRIAVADGDSASGHLRRRAKLRRTVQPSANRPICRLFRPRTAGVDGPR